MQAFALPCDKGLRGQWVESTSCTAWDPTAVHQRILLVKYVSCQTPRASKFVGSGPPLIPLDFLNVCVSCDAPVVEKPDSSSQIPKFMACVLFMMISHLHNARSLISPHVLMSTRYFMWSLFLGI